MSNIAMFRKTKHGGVMTMVNGDVACIIERDGKSYFSRKIGGKVTEGISQSELGLDNIDTQLACLYYLSGDDQGTEGETYEPDITSL